MMQFEMVGEELRQHMPVPPVSKVVLPPPSIVNFFPGRGVGVARLARVARMGIVLGLVKARAGEGTES